MFWSFASIKSSDARAHARLGQDSVNCPWSRSRSTASSLCPVNRRRIEMPKVSKESAAVVEDHGVVEDRREDVDGYTINFVSFRADIDGTPLLKGLPGDSCQCPHWGYVLKGKLTFRFPDHTEVFEAGDAFYLPPGHVPLAEAGSE